MESEPTTSFQPALAQPLLPGRATRTYRVPLVTAGAPADARRYPLIPADTRWYLLAPARALWRSALRRVQ